MTPALIAVDQDALDALTRQVEALAAQVAKLSAPVKSDWATISETAKFLECSESTVRRYITDGQLQVKHVGKRRLVKRP